MTLSRPKPTNGRTGVICPATSAGELLGKKKEFSTSCAAI